MYTEFIERYFDGTLSPQESNLLFAAMEHDSALREIFDAEMTLIHALKDDAMNIRATESDRKALFARLNIVPETSAIVQNDSRFAPWLSASLSILRNTNIGARGAMYLTIVLALITGVIGTLVVQTTSYEYSDIHPETQQTHKPFQIESKYSAKTTKSTEAKQYSVSHTKRTFRTTAHSGGVVGDSSDQQLLGGAVLSLEVHSSTENALFHPMMPTQYKDASEQYMPISFPMSDPKRLSLKNPVFPTSDKQSEWIGSGYSISFRMSGGMLVHHADLPVVGEDYSFAMSFICGLSRKISDHVSLDMEFGKESFGLRSYNFATKEHQQMYQSLWWLSGGMSYEYEPIFNPNIKPFMRGMIALDMSGLNTNFVRLMSGVHYGVGRIQTTIGVEYVLPFDALSPYEATQPEPVNGRNILLPVANTSRLNFSVGIKYQF